MIYLKFIDLAAPRSIPPPPPTTTIVPVPAPAVTPKPASQPARQSWSDKLWEKYNQRKK
ncbi:MAG: hypothetical protein JGK39_31485 [Microcoleus sp. PH2017_12_PCY_D_A]|nr:hypothetical protein [Microcoleus sp. PH2017_12_PCY_D_A]